MARVTGAVHGRFGRVKLCHKDMQVMQRDFLVIIMLTDVTGAGRILGLFLVRPDV
jgi:hypothetical protein